MNCLRPIDLLCGAYFDMRRHGVKRRMPLREAIRFQRVTASATGGVAILAHHPVIGEIAEEAAAVLLEMGAATYVQFDMLARPDKALRPIRVTVQWADGESPSEKAARLEARLQRVTAYWRERAAQFGISEHLAGEPCE